MIYGCTQKRTRTERRQSITEADVIDDVRQNIRLKGEVENEDDPETQEDEVTVPICCEMLRAMKILW